VKIEVECYAGFKADERPLRFKLGTEWHDVEEVLDRWYGPGDVYFKVRTGSTDVYILRQAGDGEWSLDAYRSG
jgi:hypothetical protein